MKRFTSVSVVLLYEKVLLHNACGCNTDMGNGTWALKDLTISLYLRVASPLFHLFTLTPHRHDLLANFPIMKKKKLNDRIDFVVYIGIFNTVIFLLPTCQGSATPRITELCL